MWENMQRELQLRGLHARLLNGFPNTQYSFLAYDVMEIGSDKVTACLIEMEFGKKIGKNELIECIYFPEHVNNVIILLCNISPPAEKAIASIQDKQVEIIRRSAISWNKASYCFMPHYELWSEKQIQAYEKKHVCKRDNFPKMFSNSPPAVLFGFKPGDVVRAVEYDTLRFVILEEKDKM